MDHATLRSVPNRGRLTSPWWLLPLGRVHPLWWAAAGAALIGLDYAAGPDFPYPVGYVIPVILAAWYSGRRSGVALAVVIPAVHILFLLAVWTRPANAGSLVAFTLLRGIFILLLAFWFSRLSEHERALQQHVQRLEGLLPICAFCKNIRTKAGDWEPIETYISNRSEAQFSHGFCPTCGKEHYPEFDDDRHSVHEMSRS
jgi:hypothetical protein